MIFLYKLEVLRFDGALTNTLPPSSITSASGVQRSVYLLTNYEAAVTTSSLAFNSAFLPSLGGDGSMLAFQPERVEHSGLRWDGEKAAGQVSLTLPMTHPVAELFKSDAPNAQVWLTIAAVNQPTGAPPRVLFIGEITAADFDEHRCKLAAIHLRSLLERPSLTRKHPRSCPHSLYDPTTCRVNPHAFDASAGYFTHREDGVVSSITSDRLSVLITAAANRPAGFFEGGFVVFGGSYSSDPATSDGKAFYLRTGGLTSPQAASAQLHGGVRRTIQRQNPIAPQSLFLLTALPPGVVAGDRVTLYRGCAKTPDAHKEFFPDLATFGGYPVIPIKNPFTSGLKQ